MSPSTYYLWYVLPYPVQNVAAGIAGGGGVTDCAVMAVELIRSTRLFDGVPYAYAATARGTDLVFTAGACPLDSQGRVVAPGDIAAQARQTLDNLRVVLDECGDTLGHVLKSTIYVASGDRGDLVAAWSEVARAFGDHDAPSTLLGVAMLGYPDQLVEIEAIAAVPAAS
jgi:enamine deaminase RidA (YjgF/YER057c/UK114 family)